MTSESPETANQSTAVVVANDGGKELHLVATTLQKAGFSVVATSRIAGALQKKRSAGVDLAVVDADGANASSLLEQVHELCPSARMLLLSDEGDARLSAIPAYGHVRKALQKPYKRRQLLESVLALMDQPKVLTA